MASPSYADLLVDAPPGGILHNCIKILAPLPMPSISLWKWACGVAMP